MHDSEKVARILLDILYQEGDGVRIEKSAGGVVIYDNAILQYHDIVVLEETFNWIVKTIHTNSTTVDKEEMRKTYEMQEEESIMAAEPDVEKK